MPSNRWLVKWMMHPHNLYLDKDHHYAGEKKQERTIHIICYFSREGVCGGWGQQKTLYSYLLDSCKGAWRDKLRTFKQRLPVSRGGGVCKWSV